MTHTIRRVGERRWQVVIDVLNDYFEEDRRKVHVVSEHPSPTGAAAWCSYLNGGVMPEIMDGTFHG